MKTAIVLHHSADPSQKDQFEKIDAYHRGKWGRGIEYSYLIEPSGEVKQGRPENSTGYHAGNWLINTISIGICVAGDFTKHPPSARQIQSLSMLVTDIQKRWGIADTEIMEHRDIKSTACPGTNLKALVLEEHENLMRQRLLRAENAVRWATPRRKKLLDRLIERLRRILVP